MLIICYECDDTTSKWRRNRSQKIKCLAFEGELCVFEDALRYTTRQAVKCFRRANFNNVTSQERHNKGDPSFQSAFTPMCIHFCSSVRLFCPFLPVHPRLVPLYTCLASPIITLGITNATELPRQIYSVLPRHVLLPSLYRAYIHLSIRLGFICQKMDSTNGINI